ncbi:hypothetical protein ACWGH5_38925 [Streptomyces sp. NPDC054864]
MLPGSAEPSAVSSSVKPKGAFSSRRISAVWPLVPVRARAN